MKKNFTRVLALAMFAAIAAPAPAALAFKGKKKAKKIKKAQTAQAAQKAQKAEAKKIKKAAKAAVKIQSLQRGRAVRQKAKAAKATKEAQEKELEDFARPATLTESILPEKIGGLQRSLLEAKKDVKNLVDSEGLEKANKKILDLQRVARGRFGRKAAQQAKAAVKIQSLQRERAVRQKAKAAKAAALSSTPAVTSSSAVQAVPSVPPVAPVVAVTSTQTETKKTANIETQISEEELKKEALAKKLAAFNLKNPKHSAEEIKTTHEAPCATNNELAEDITKKARAKESPDFLSFTTEATLSDEKKLEVLKKVTPVRFTDRDKTFLLNKKSEFIKKLVETKRKLEQKQDEITEIESKEQSQGMLKAGWQAFKGFAGYNKNANQLKKLKSETKTLSELIEKENERVEEVVKLFQPATAKLSVVNMLGEHVKLLNGTRAPEVKATPICNYEQTQGKVLLQQQKYATEKREAAEAAKAQEAKAITKAETAKAAKAKHWKRVGIAHAIGGGVAIAGLTAELGLGYASYKKSGGKLGFFKFVKNHFAGLKKAIASGNFKALAKIYPATVATILTATVDAAYWIGYEGIYKSGFSKLYNKTAPKVTDAATYVKDKTVNGYDWCHEKITHQKANAAAAADDALNLGFRDVFAPKTSITVITPKAEVPAAPKGILKKNTTEKAQRETAKNVTFKSTESQENKQQPEVATTTQAG